MDELSSNIIQVSDLSSYFYERLYHANSKSLCPVPEETIFYSSYILNKYSLSSEFFDQTSGKVKNKTLGLSILEASKKTKEERRRLYKDIADTALVLTGFFGDSINRKLIDRSYYIQVGQIAYSKMYAMDEHFMDIPHFYKMMATCFENLSYLINLTNPLSSHLYSGSEGESLIQGISLNKTLKVS